MNRGAGPESSEVYRRLVREARTIAGRITMPGHVVRSSGEREHIAATLEKLAAYVTHILNKVEQGRRYDE